MEKEPDFRTPLSIHRAAFARISAGIGLPPQALEGLRTGYQAAERSGDPKREIDAVSNVVGDYVWTWPWFDQCAVRLVAGGLAPFAWVQSGLAAPFHWPDVPHNMRVRLLILTLGVAVFSEKHLVTVAMLRKNAVATYSSELSVLDQRCLASAAMVAKHGAAIASGDLTALPPYFPGDTTWIKPVKVRP